MLHYVSKGEIFVEVPAKKSQCLFHDKESAATVLALREKEGSQLLWSLEHLFQNLPDSHMKNWVIPKRVDPLNEFYEMIKRTFEEDLEQSLDINEPFYAFQFSYIPQLNEADLVGMQSVFYLRRYKKQKCYIKFQHIHN